MAPRHANRSAATAGILTTPARLALLFAALLVLSSARLPAAPAFPGAPTGELKITYPLDETLFPPDIVAPTFTWNDETEGAGQWQVLLRFGNDRDVLQFTTEVPNWRPTEHDWAIIKQRSVAQYAEMAVVGIGPQGSTASAAMVRIRTSSDPVGDSIFYREVPLPFIEAVQDPSRIRWRYGSVDSVDQPPVVLEDLPVCGN